MLINTNYLKGRILPIAAAMIMMAFFAEPLIGSHSNASNLQNKISHLTLSSNFYLDTIPMAKESMTIQKKTNDSDIKMSMENGEITLLEVNGEKIPADQYDKYSDIINEVKPRRNGGVGGNMFFFDQDGDGTMTMRLNQRLDMDSLFGNMDNPFEAMGGRMFDQQDIFDQLNQMRGQMGNGISFGKLFNLDSLGFQWNDFTMPDIDELKNGTEFKFFGPDGGPLFDADGIAPSDDMDEEGFNNAPKDRASNISESLGNALNKDGLLIPGKENRVELTGKALKINGEKQPTNIWNKYKRIFEEQSGTTLEKNSRIEFVFEGKESKRKYKVY